MPSSRWTKAPKGTSLVTLPSTCADRVLWTKARHGSSGVGLRDREIRSRFEVDVEHLDVDLLAHLDDLGGVVDVVPRQLGDVHEAVDATQIHEGTEVDDGGNAPLSALPLLCMV